MPKDGESFETTPHKEPRLPLGVWLPPPWAQYQVYSVDDPWAALYGHRGGKLLINLPAE